MIRISIVFSVLLFSLHEIHSQTLLHSENFSSGLNGYSTSLISSVTISTANPSNIYPFASGGNNVLFRNNFVGSDTLYSPVISTVGFETIRILFGHRRRGGTLPRSLLFFNGVSWVAGPSIPVPTGPWSSSDTLTFSPDANQKANFRFAIVVSCTNVATRNLSFDDFRVFGEPAAALDIFYSKSIGALNDLNTWGTNTDGSGTSPTNFIADDIIYVIANNPAPSLTAPWTVAGLGSRILVTNGSNLIVPPSSPMTGVIDIEGGGAVTLNNDTSSGIVFNNLAVNSSVVYNASEVQSANYGNLIINQTAGVVSIEDSIGVRGVLSLQEGDLSIGNAALSIFGSGSISYGINSFLRGEPLSRVYVQTGSNSAGQLRFRTGFDTIQQLILSGTVSMGTDLVIAGNCELSSGSYSFTVGANTIATSGFSGAGINNIVTDSTSNLILNGNTSLYQLPSAIQALNNLTINRPSIVRMSGPLSVYSNLNLINGSFQVLSNTLTLFGDHTIDSGTFSPSSGIVQYFQNSDGQRLIQGNYTSLVLNDFNKIFPVGNLSISNVFSPGNAANHNLTGNTITFTGIGLQTIPAFQYLNLRSFNGGPRILQANDTIKVSNTFNPGTSSFTTTNSTFMYNGGSQDIVSSANLIYHNIQIEGTGTKTLTSDLSCTGNIVVSSGSSINTNNLNLTIGGNFTNLGSVNLGNSLVRVEGSTNQIFTGFFPVRDLIISNTSDTALTINTGMADSISISRQLVVASGAGSVVTNNKLILQDGARIVDSASTVGPQGSVLGSVTLYRIGNTIAGSPIRWNHTSSPVRSADALDSVLMSGGFLPRRYVETVVSTNIDTGWQNISGTNLEVGRGYATARPGTMVWRGQVNNGSYTYPITLTPSSNPSVDGWNLLGNPYPSGISSAAFHSANAGIFAGNALYIWNATTQTYTTIDNLGDETIPSCQGFFVQATGNTTVNFNNAMRTANNGALLRQSREITELTLKLRAEETIYDVTKILISPSATEHHDLFIDAYKLWSEGPVEIASRASSLGAYAIQGIPEVQQHRTLPLSVSLKSSGRYTFSVDYIQGFDGYEVLIEDTETRKFYSLNYQQEYSFVVNGALKSDNRFKLHLMNEETPLTQSLNVLSDPFVYRGYNRDAVIDFNSVLEQSVVVSVYSMSGQKQRSEIVPGGTQVHSLDLATYPAGVYLIEIQSADYQRKTYKFILD